MKHQVVSQGGGQGPEGNSGSKYKIPTLSFIALALPGCVQAAETAIVNKNLELKAGDWHSFSNQSEGMTPKEKVILDNYAVSASLFLNPLNEIRSTPLTIGGTSVLQNNAISSDGIVNKVEFAVTDIKSVDASGQSVSNTSTIISFRDDNVEPTEGEFDVTTRSFIFDSNLSTSAIRSETDEHTLVTLRGVDLNKQTAPFMIIVMDKLPANANIHEAMKDPEKVREVSIFNPVTGEELVVPQEEQTSSLPTSTPTPNELPLDIIELIGNLIEPSQGVSAQEPTPSVPMIEVDGLQIPDPKASNPELFDVTNPDSPIVQFANAFEVKPEDVGAGLHVEMETPDGMPAFTVLRTADGVALMMAQQGENGEWKWQASTLGKYWSAYGKHIGLSMNGDEWRYSNNKSFVLKYFTDGGILGLLGQVRPGPDIEERRPSGASAYLEFAKQSNMAFMFNNVVEPGKFPKGTTAENVDQWLNRRLSEIVDVIVQNKSDQPVYIQFNEATNEKGGWNSDNNPLKEKYGDQWMGEYLYQVLSNSINKGLIPNKDFFPLFNENSMFVSTNQQFLHSKLVEARESAFQRLISDPIMTDKLKSMGINNAEDLQIILGSQTYVNLDGRASNGINFVKDPSIKEINQLTDLFSDLGGVIFTEVSPQGNVSQKAVFLNKIVSVLKENPNLKGVLLWNVFNNPDDAKDKFMQSPTLLFNSDGTPTQLFFELLRETPTN